MIAPSQRRIRASLCAATLLLGSAASGQQPVASAPVAAGPAPAPPAAEALPAAPAAFDAGAVEWRPEFRRVGWPEYVATPLLWAGVLAEGVLLKPVTEPRWTGPILFDRALQHALRASSASGRTRADAISNVLIATSVLQLALVDPWLSAAWIHRRPEVAWQMTVIDAEILGLTGFANSVTKRLAARERPYGERCEEDPDIGHCESSTRYRSFFSGHANNSAAFAGLTCAHHQQLALYGSFAADLSACLASVGVSLATGMLRVSADLHWGSDVLVGHLVGFSTGYLLTSLLYYRGAADPSQSRSPLLAPIVGSGVIGLALGGQL